MKSAACTIAIVLAIAVARPATAQFNTVALQSAIDGLSSRASAARGSLDSGTAGQIDSAISGLTNKKLAIDRQISDHDSLRTRIDERQSRVGRLKIEWESAKSRYKQKYNDWMRETERIRQGFVSQNRAATEHNARESTIDNTNRAAVEAYNREGRRITDWGKRLEREQADLGKKLGEVTRLQQEASRKERAYYDVKLEVDRLKGELDGKRSQIQGQIDSVYAQVRGLEGAIASVGPAPRPSGPRRVVTSSNAYERRVVEFRPASPPARSSYGGTIPTPAARSRPAAGSAATHTYFLPAAPNATGVARELADKIQRDSVSRKLEDYQPAQAGRKKLSLGSVELVRSATQPPRSTNGSFRGIAPADGVDAALIFGRIADPGRLISPAAARRAQAEIDRLDPIIAKLDAEILKLQAWADRDETDQEELEKIHADAVNRSIEDLFGLIQLGNMAKGLSKIDRFKHVFTDDLVREVELAETAIKVAIDGWDAYREDKTQKDDYIRRADKATSAAASVVGVIEKQIERLNPKDPRVQTLAAVGKFIQIAGKGVAYSEREWNRNTSGQPADKTDRAGTEDLAMTLAEAAAVLNPVGAGVLAGGKFASSSFERHLLEKMLDDVSYGLHANYDAQYHLRTQLERYRWQRTQQERLVFARGG